MYVNINTNGATNILINIPHQGSDKSLPAMASMLEKNAVFICSGYNEIKIVEPEMTIELKDCIKFEAGSYDKKQSIIIKPEDSGAIINDDFVPATNEVFVSNKKAMEMFSEKNETLRKELDFLKTVISQNEAEIERLESELKDQHLQAVADASRYIEE